MVPLRVLRTSQLPLLLQLRVEEALYRASTDNWLLINDGADAAAIVLGISGKPHELVKVRAAHRAQVPLIKRFSGGGTVVVDHNTILTSIVLSKAAVPDVQPFPQPIMSFASQVFADVFDLLPRDPSRVPSSRQSALTHDGDAEFTLLENDFTFGGQKIAGNAQAISAKRWLQHTSFLWDYQKERMQLLQEPAKRPKYRGERKHGSFLTPLVALGYRRDEFVEGIEDSMASRGFTLQPADLDDVLPLLEEPHLRTTKLLDYADLLTPS